MLADLRELTDAPVRWVVNTHAHFDHTFGNDVFADATGYTQEPRRPRWPSGRPTSAATN